MTKISNSAQILVVMVLGIVNRMLDGDSIKTS